MKHTYPSQYGPDHPSPFVRMAWALLDSIAPGAMPDDVRFLLAGMIAGALSKAHELGQEGRSADELATGGPSRPLRRAEAAVYLHDKHGITRSRATLAKLAVIGGGPAFRRVGRVPLYSPADLDIWAASITSAPVHSTSELP